MSLLWTEDMERIRCMWNTAKTRILLHSMIFSEMTCSVYPYLWNHSYNTISPCRRMFTSTKVISRVTNLGWLGVKSFDRVWAFKDIHLPHPFSRGFPNFCASNYPLKIVRKYLILYSKCQTSMTRVGTFHWPHGLPQWNSDWLTRVDNAKWIIIQT